MSTIEKERTVNNSSTQQEVQKTISKELRIINQKLTYFTIQKELSYRKILEIQNYLLKNSLRDSLLEIEAEEVTRNLHILANNSLNTNSLKHIPNQTDYENIFHFLSQNLRHHKFPNSIYTLMIVFYFVSNFGLKPLSLQTVTKKELQMIEKFDVFSLENEDYLITPKAKENFLHLKKHLPPTYFFNLDERILNLQPATIARNLNQKLKEVNLEFSLNDFRFSFVHYILIQNIMDQDTLRAYLKLNKSRMYQLTHTRVYKPRNPEEYTVLHFLEN